MASYVLYGDIVSVSIMHNAVLHTDLNDCFLFAIYSIGTIVSDPFGLYTWNAVTSYV